jgi:16S rRNA (guanine(966)-N(2))-methyltransferase RsmD
LRIVAGKWSGRRLDAAPGTRPTAERTREALFSIWQERVPSARFLDLFCGSGAAGLEALSRGAAAAPLVDGDARTLAVATRNRDRLSAPASSCRTVRASLPAGFARAAVGAEPFDLVFADPPYDFDAWVELLDAIAPKLAAEGEIVIEHTARVDLPVEVAGLERVASRRYGDTALSFYRRSVPSSP